VYVRSTARLAIHLQFNLSANSLVIRALQSAKCMVWCAVDCTWTYSIWWYVYGLVLTNNASGCDDGVVDEDGGKHEQVGASASGARRHLHGRDYSRRRRPPPRHPRITPLRHATRAQHLKPNRKHYIVFLIANNFGKTWASRRKIWDASATPSGIKREWYVCSDPKTRRHKIITRGAQWPRGQSTRRAIAESKQRS
jgi:hypothetical protein